VVVVLELKTHLAWLAVTLLIAMSAGQSVSAGPTAVLAEKTPRAEMPRVDGRPRESEVKRDSGQRMPSLAAEYVELIQARVLREWVLPDGITQDFSCTVTVVQRPGGQVIRASVEGSCSAGIVAERSIIAAVRRANPLPYRGYESVFSDELSFEFPPSR
jgi:hypothetical protein